MRRVLGAGRTQVPQPDAAYLLGHMVSLHLALKETLKLSPKADLHWQWTEGSPALHHDQELVLSRAWILAILECV